jgi:hypothetical protein
MTDNATREPGWYVIYDEAGAFLSLCWLHDGWWDGGNALPELPAGWTVGPSLADVLRDAALINSPQTANFLGSVKTEAAHQVKRWGAAHDRGKSAENWYWLVGYLAGKALRSVIEGDNQKALHHTISTAAALSHWHEAIRREGTHQRGRGDDRDLEEIARFDAEIARERRTDAEEPPK